MSDMRSSGRSGPAERLSFEERHQAKESSILHGTPRASPTETHKAWFRLRKGKQNMSLHDMSAKSQGRKPKSRAPCTGDSAATRRRSSDTVLVGAIHFAPTMGLSYKHFVTFKSELCFVSQSLGGCSVVVSSSRDSCREYHGLMIIPLNLADRLCCCFIMPDLTKQIFFDVTPKQKSRDECKYSGHERTC